MPTVVDNSPEAGTTNNTENIDSPTEASNTGVCNNVHDNDAIKEELYEYEAKLDKQVKKVIIYAVIKSSEELDNLEVEITKKFANLDVAVKSLKRRIWGRRMCLDNCSMMEATF